MGVPSAEELVLARRYTSQVYTVNIQVQIQVPVGKKSSSSLKLKYKNRY